MRLRIAGGVLAVAGLTGCSTEMLQALNVALACQNAYPNNSYAQNQCLDDYNATGYLPQPVTYSTSTYGGYGSYGSNGAYGNGYGGSDYGYSSTSTERTVGGSGFGSDRANALSNAYHNATMLCYAGSGSVGATETQTCAKTDGGSWSCTVRVWCG